MENTALLLRDGPLIFLPVPVLGVAKAVMGAVFPVCWTGK